MKYDFSRKTQNKLSAPVWVWVAALIVSCAILITTFIYHKCTATTPDSFYNTARIKLFENVALFDTYTKIIVVGTSLTRHAFYKDEEMEHFASINGLNMHFLRFTKNGGNLSDFRLLIEYLLKAKPDLICFESAIFAINFNQKHSWKIKHSSYLKSVIKLYLLKLVAKTFKKEYFVIDGESNFKDIDLIHYKVRKYGLAEYQKTVHDLSLYDFSYGNGYRYFFEKAREQGIKIVLLDLSRSKDAWDVLPPNREKEIKKLMDQYQKTYGIKYLRFPYKLSLDYFVDYNHFSQKGRVFYSKWFIKQIPELLKSSNK